MCTPTQVDVAKMLPQAFGLSSHRLRLKAGASGKLQVSFLPFYMPAPAPSPATGPSKGGKGKGKAAQSESPPLVRSLLVLKDSECGEFTYELCGEVAQPGPFLQHEAKVGLDGQQVRAGYNYLLCRNASGSVPASQLACRWLGNVRSIPSWVSHQIQIWLPLLADCFEVWL